MKTASPPKAAKAPIRNNARPAYAIYMFDSVKQTMAVVACARPAGFIYTDPMALEARANPNALNRLLSMPIWTTHGACLKCAACTTPTVRPHGRRGADCHRTCLPVATTAIAKTTPATRSTRGASPILVRMKNPANSAYGCGRAALSALFARCTAIEHHGFAFCDW